MRSTVGGVPAFDAFLVHLAFLLRDLPDVLPSAVQHPRTKIMTLRAL